MATPEIKAPFVIIIILGTPGLEMIRLSTYIAFCK
jgi:hypothetical protein